MILGSSDVDMRSRGMLRSAAGSEARAPGLHVRLPLAGFQTLKAAFLESSAS
jgi:hypothetical protein